MRLYTFEKFVHFHTHGRVIFIQSRPILKPLLFYSSVWISFDISYWINLIVYPYLTPKILRKGAPAQMAPKNVQDMLIRSRELEQATIYAKSLKTVSAAVKIISHRHPRVV